MCRRRVVVGTRIYEIKMINKSHTFAILHKIYCICNKYWKESFNIKKYVINEVSMYCTASFTFSMIEIIDLTRTLLLHKINSLTTLDWYRFFYQCKLTGISN